MAPAAAFRRRRRAKRQGHDQTVDWELRSKPLESFEERLSRDTFMQRLRKIAVMPIGHWLKIVARG
jgi:hypothetical protein